MSGSIASTIVVGVLRRIVRCARSSFGSCPPSVSSVLRLRRLLFLLSCCQESLCFRPPCRSSLNSVFVICNTYILDTFNFIHTLHLHFHSSYKLAVSFVRARLVGLWVFVPSVSAFVPSLFVFHGRCIQSSCIFFCYSMSMNRKMKGYLRERIIFHHLTLHFTFIQYKQQPSSSSSCPCGVVFLGVCTLVLFLLWDVS